MLEFTLTDIQFFFYASSVTINSPIVCRVQLEISEESTEYEPFTDPVIKLSDENGVVSEVKSLNPNMTLFTDTAGVIVECEYNKDLNKVIKILMDEILKLKE